MNFHDRAFEKAYLEIIKESAGFPEDETACPECGNSPCTCDGEACDNCCADCGSELDENGECVNPECPAKVTAECGGNGCVQCKGDEDLAEEAKDDDEEEVEVDAEVEEPADDTEVAAAAEEELPEGGKFISFFTTNEDLIKALQDGFAKISVTGTDEKAEPIDFETDAFENLSIEDLKDEEEPAEGDDAEAEVDVEVDDEAAAKDEAADKKDDKKEEAKK